MGYCNLDKIIKLIKEYIKLNSPEFISLYKLSSLIEKGHWKEVDVIMEQESPLTMDDREALIKEIKIVYETKENPDPEYNEYAVIDGEEELIDAQTQEIVESYLNGEDEATNIELVIEKPITEISLKLDKKQKRLRNKINNRVKRAALKELKNKIKEENKIKKLEEFRLLEEHKQLENFKNIVKICENTAQKSFMAELILKSLKNIA